MPSAEVLLLLIFAFAVSVAVLMIMVVPLYYASYWIIGDIEKLLSKSKVLQNRLPKEQIKSVSKDLLAAVVVGGIVGGIAFSLVSPVLMPGINNAQVEHGFVNEPNLKVNLQYTEEYPDNASEYLFGKEWRSDYVVQTISFENENERLISSLNVLLVFPGCIETRRPEPLSGSDVAVVNSQVKFEHSRERIRTQSVCSDKIHIENLPKGKVIEFQYLLDTDPEAGKQPAGTISYWTLSNNQVRVSSHYVWSFNGREYVASPHSSNVINGTLDGY